MTELERVLLAKLEQIEQRHEQQTEDLRRQLQQQAHSLSALQKVCSDALRSCGKLCGDLHEEIRTLQSGVTHSNKVTSAALGSLNSSVSALNKALENLQSAQG